MADATPNRSRRAPTLADVGREAGVSAMAVSAVLNGTRTSVRIAEATQERIREAAAKLHYRPNAAARALVKRRMNTLGLAVVIDYGEANHYFLEVFNGIIEGAAHRGQNAMIFTLHNWQEAGPRIAAAFDGRIDGMILVAPVVTAAFSRWLRPHTPVVALHANEAVPGLLNVVTDEESGARALVRHLIELGHRRILHLSGRRGLNGAEQRIAGYEAALREAGLEPDARLLVSTEYSAAAGRASMAEWLRANVGQPLPHAIFCASDAIAVGAIEALAAAGLRVPEDVSVGGFDDTMVARATVPQLTTVRQPLRAMGGRAVDLLLERIEGGAAAPGADAQSVVLPTELVCRGSTAPFAAERTVAAMPAE